MIDVEKDRTGHDVNRTISRIQDLLIHDESGESPFRTALPGIR